MAEERINKLVIIASSTGGPKALHEVVSDISPRIDAPVVIVQHMPKGFTTTLAQRLNSLGDIPVSEASDGAFLQKGHVYLARGGYHLEVCQDHKQRLLFRENEEEPVNGLRPCANVTFDSLRTVKLDYIVNAVLTGMGADGCAGIDHLHSEQTTYTIAQNRESCVVYGMPKAVVEHGLADIVLPLNEIGKEITKRVGVR